MVKQEHRAGIMATIILKPGREERPLISRVALHAEELIFPHPVTNETVTIKSEWPKDLKVALKYLRLYAN